MSIVMVDCYTDEPSGLGVPPYLGVYPRYLYGHLKKQGEKKITYLTIDDIRLAYKYSGKILVPKEHQRTNISTTNLTINYEHARQLLDEAQAIYFIVGVHVPGKYLSAVPGTLHEVVQLLGKAREVQGKERILCGPVTIGGSQVFGGKETEKVDSTFFTSLFEINRYEYDVISDLSLLGAEMVKQVPDLRMIEIETGKGCQKKVACSFCLEPIKNREMYRKKSDILEEIGTFYGFGARHFRLGKQSCFYGVPEAASLLEEIRAHYPDIETLHIDNVNPVNVLRDANHGYEITKAIVKHCTDGNIAAFGCETFDEEVVRKNDLNSGPKTSYRAIEIVNKLGAERGPTGMPKFLPGINIIFGLIGESKKTHVLNIEKLQEIIHAGFLLRRINIRTVIPYEGTKLKRELGLKMVKKHHSLYYKWRKEIREKIDFVNLQHMVPAGTVLRKVRMEIYDGKTTFGRQMGTYPLIVGVKKRVALGKFYDVRVKQHMLRSVEGEII